MTNTPEPALAPPGAGIPALERLIGKMIFLHQCRKRDRDQFSADFARERAMIRSRVDSCPENRRGERVLISRLRGLEDSSRYWSILMTLDHLRITNLAFAGVILSLTHNRIPEGVASTAAVKPDPAVTSAVESEYEMSCDDLIALLNRTKDLRTSLRYAHPWFGPLDAAQWHALSTMHMGIHRRQIEAILLKGT
jgi:hypothetical protein